MATTNKTTPQREAKRKSKKPTLEENRTRNMSVTPGNKYMKAFLSNQGSFIVYDPNFM